MTDKKYRYWLPLEQDKFVQFSELAHLMAKALHPELDDVELALTEIDLEAELKQAVRDDLLRVRNPSTLGFHTFPHGDALQRAVLIPDTDLESFLNERSIGLRLIPPGNGPDYWTLENAAVALQEQLNWTDTQRKLLQNQMQEAADSGTLVILDPQTLLPTRPEKANPRLHIVTPQSVNKLLSKLEPPPPYRWELQANTPQPQPKQERANEWVSDAQSRAHEIIKEQRAKDLYPDQLGIADRIASEFRKAGRVGADGKPLSGAYIKRHALKGISSAIAKQLSTTKRQSK